MSENFNVSHFFIIESLRPDETKTGTDLHNEVFKYNYWRGGLQTGRITALSKNQFFDALAHIASLARTKGMKPFIHFEVHGSPNGLELANRDFISWKELTPALSEINEISKNHLFITLATCYGAYISMSCDPTCRAPFAWYIGPEEQITSTEVYSDYTTFFDTLHRSRDVVTALNAMNTQNPKQPYKLFSTEDFFRETLNIWMAGYQNSESRESKIKSLIAYARNNGITLPDDILRMIVQKHLEEMPAKASQHLDYFLFRSEVDNWF